MSALGQALKEMDEVLQEMDEDLKKRKKVATYPDPTIIDGFLDATTKEEYWAKVKGENEVKMEQKAYEPPCGVSAGLFDAVIKITYQEFLYAHNGAKITFYYNEANMVIGFYAQGENSRWFLAEVLSLEQHKRLGAIGANKIVDAKDFFYRLISQLGDRVTRTKVVAPEEPQQTPQSCLHLNNEVAKGQRTVKCRCGATVLTSLVVLNLLEKAAFFHEKLFSDATDPAVPAPKPALPLE